MIAQPQSLGRRHPGAVRLAVFFAVGAGLVAVGAASVLLSPIQLVPVAVMVMAVAAGAMLGLRRLITGLGLLWAVTVTWTGIKIPGLPLTLGDLVALAFGALVIITPSDEARRRGPTRMIAGSVLLCVGSFVGAAFSRDQASSVFWAFVRAGPTIATLLVVRRWYPGVRTIERAILAFVAGVAISTVSAIAGFSKVRGVSERVQGLAHHPNQLAGHALMALGLALAMALWGRRHRVAFAALSPLLFLAVMLSGSRSAVAALGAVLVVVSVQGWRQGWKLRQVGAVVALAAILVTGVVSLPSTLTVDRLLKKEDTEVSDVTRWSRLEGEADRILAHPLSGSGLLTRERAHNIYVEALSSAGLLGLLGLLMVIAEGVRGAFVRLPKGRGAYDPLVVLICALSTAVIGFAVHEAFQNALWNRWFWFAAGLLLVTRDRAAASRPGAAQMMSPV